jgi:hypothetical protein
MADATVENAIRMTEWFADEQLRMLQSSRQNVLRKQMEDLRDLLLTKYPQGTTLRKLENDHNKPKELVDRIVQEFPAIFVIKEHQPAGGGKTIALALPQQNSPVKVWVDCSIEVSKVLKV